MLRGDIALLVLQEPGSGALEGPRETELSEERDVLLAIPPGREGHVDVVAPLDDAGPNVLEVAPPPRGPDEVVPQDLGVHM